jgi:hypothetical protein
MQYTMRLVISKYKRDKCISGDPTLWLRARLRPPSVSSWKWGGAFLLRLGRTGVFIGLFDLELLDLLILFVLLDVGPEVGLSKREGRERDDVAIDDES